MFIKLCYFGFLFYAYFICFKNSAFFRSNKLIQNFKVLTIYTQMSFYHQQVQEYLVSNININESEDIKILINGAAFVIQRAWSSYQKYKRKSLIYSGLSYQQSNVCNFKDYDVLPDVMLLVKKKLFYCHSVVLWSNSEFFKEQIESFNNHRILESETNSQYKYKFELFVDLECWELICNFIYGKRIKIHKKVFKY